MASGGILAAVSLAPPYELVQQVGLTGPATAIAWHPRLNQILVASGAKAKGWTHVLYSPDMSEKGALLCAGKGPRQKNTLDYEPPLVIHNPGALPMYRDDNWRKRRRVDDGKVRRTWSQRFRLFLPLQTFLKKCQQKVICVCAASAAFGKEHAPAKPLHVVVPCQVRVPTGLCLAAMRVCLDSMHLQHKLRA